MLTRENQFIFNCVALDFPFRIPEILPNYIKDLINHKNTEIIDFPIYEYGEKFLQVKDISIDKLYKAINRNKKIALYRVANSDLTKFKAIIL